MLRQEVSLAQMKLILLFAIAAALLGQTLETKAPPTPKEKARELLDAVAEAAPGAKADVAAIALGYVAENYNEFDHKKAVEWLRQGFAITAGIAPSSRDARALVQSNLAMTATKISLDDAIGMVEQIVPTGKLVGVDPRQRAIEAITAHLIEKGDLDRAVELLNSLGSTGEYPFHAAQLVFEKLPAGDGRREALFGYSMSAYGLRPGDDFVRFVGKHWKALPRAQAVAAVGAILENTLKKKVESADQYTGTLTSDKGTVTFSDPQSIELFDVLYIVREVEPKRAAELLDTRFELKSALERFPKGRESMGEAVSWNMSFGSGKSDAPEQSLNGLADSRFAQAINLLGKTDEKADAKTEKEQLEKALEMVKTIPLPDRRANALGIIADAAGAEDPVLAKRLLSECLEVIKDVKDVSLRQPIWDHVVGAAHAIHDDKLAWEAVDHSLSDATELYNKDTDADHPNAAIRDWWPSTNAYRRSVIAATKAFGIEAEVILQKITDPDLAVFARVEMAATLLGHARASWMTWVDTGDK